MSVQPLTPPDPPPLLAVVSSIMDFPAPGIASPEDYARLVEQLGRLCPLQHFAMLGLADGEGMFSGIDAITDAVIGRGAAATG